MNIAFFLSHYPAPGGTSTAVRGLSQGIAAAGHAVSILALGRQSTRFKDGQVEVRIFRRLRPAKQGIVSPTALRFLARNEGRLDLIVLNGIFHPDLPPLAIAARLGRIPYLVAPHDPYHPMLFEKSGVRKRLYWWAIEQRLLAQSAAVQILSANHVACLRERRIATPTVTVPNGFLHEAFDGTVRPLAAGPPIIGYLGRIDAWHKGLDILLEGFAKVKQSPISLALVIAGRDWGDLVRLRTLSDQLSIADRVSFPGALEGSSVTIIANWDIFVLPSRFDGFGLSALEAMLAARPIICSNQAGIAEHVSASGAGVVIDPTPEGVAKGIAELLEMRPYWKEMGEAGRDYAMKQLTWNAIASGAVEKYRQLLETRSNGVQ